MDEKKLHTREFQLKGIGGNMRGKLLQKRSTGKTTECSKHLQHIAIEKDIFSELNNRCIFQISLKYIKLAIPKILFILILSSFNFYFKITWPAPPPSPSHQNKNFWPPSKYISDILTPPPQAGGVGWGACPEKKSLSNTNIITIMINSLWLVKLFYKRTNRGSCCWAYSKSFLDKPAKISSYCLWYES